MNALRMILIFSLFTVGALSGCANTETIAGPDGTPHQLVTCTDIKQCYRRAREVCGGQYEIVNVTKQAASSEVNPPTLDKVLVKCR